MENKQLDLNEIASRQKLTLNITPQEQPSELNRACAVKKKTRDTRGA